MSTVKQDADTVLRTLGKAKREAEAQKAILERELQAAQSNRMKVVAATADTLLPNMEQATLQKLRRLLPRFGNQADVQAVFDTAAKVEIPRLTFWRTHYRTQQCAAEFKNLREKLARYIDSYPPSSEILFSAVQTMTNEVAAVQRKLDEAVSRIGLIRQRIADIERIRDSRTSRTSPHMQASMSQAAADARRAEDTSDDSLDILTYAVTGVPTSGRTLLWDALTGANRHSPEPAAEAPSRAAHEERFSPSRDDSPAERVSPRSDDVADTASRYSSNHDSGGGSSGADYGSGGGSDSGGGSSSSD